MNTPKRPPRPLEAHHRRLLRKLATGHTVERAVGHYFQVAVKDKTGLVVEYVGGATVQALENRALVVVDYLHGKRVWRITEAGLALIGDEVKS